MKPLTGTVDLDAIAGAVWERARADGFMGHDPYDGLKSRRLAYPLARSRWLRLAVIQGVKRCPWNLRPVLGVPPGSNPKALGLLMQAISRRPDLATENDRRRLVDLMAGLASRPDGSAVFAGRAAPRGRAQQLVADGAEALGWGYDFPWQSKVFLQPAYYPTVVCTSFAVDGLSDLVHPLATTSIHAAAAFVRKHLHRHEDETGVCYSYSPRDRTRVYNASLFAGKILARASRLVGPAEAAAYRDEAAATVEYVAARQADDGHWVYGEADHWQWVDNFHTGFVLETIADIAALIGEPDHWSRTLATGLAFYRGHLLGPDLTPYYHADRPHVLDAHTVAQSALTLLRFADRDVALRAAARRVIELGVAGLWQPQRAGFAFQRGRLLANRTVFLRWSQAWMLRAICTLRAAEEDEA